MTDILVCSLLYNIDIDIYKYNNDTNLFVVDKIRSQYKNDRIVNILYSNNNHFEALIKI